MSGGSTCDAFPVGAFFYYNCFGEPVLSGTPVRMDKELHESKSLFKRRSSVIQHPFDGVPQRQCSWTSDTTRMRNRRFPGVRLFERKVNSSILRGHRRAHMDDVYTRLLS